MSSSFCYCQPPTTTTIVNDYSIPSAQYVQETLIVAGTLATLTSIPIAAATVIVWINGVMQRQGIDYTLTVATGAIVFTNAPNVLDQVSVFYIKAV